MSHCQRSLPSSVSRLTRSRRAEVLLGKSAGTFGGQRVRSVDWVSKLRSPQIAGVEFPYAGTGAFQRTFSAGLYLAGTFLSSDKPWPVGPRHAVQLPPCTHERPTAITSTARIDLM